MLIFKNINNEALNGLISTWQTSHKTVFSNFFGLNENVDYEYYESDSTFLIRKQEFNFFRIYLLSDDKNDLVLLLNGLCDATYVFNIPTKKPIDDWNVILKDGGFNYFETYSKMSNTKFVNMKYHQTEGTSFASYDEVDQIQTLMRETFSLYTSHIPTKEELKKMIMNENIRVDHSEEGKVCGLIIYNVVGTTATSSAWISKGEHSMDLYFDMYNHFLEKGAKRFIFWVRDTNVGPYKLYLKYGAVPMGVKDYTYVKQQEMGL